ncbi:MAG: TRAP transporter small permease subunit [Pseudomonadota bacterium]
MPTLLTQRAWLESLTRWLALLGFVSLVTICCLTMYDGLARYVGLPRVPGFRDFGEVVFAVLIACAFPIGLLRNQNITITFLGSALGDRPGRWLNLLSATATLLAFALLAYAMVLRSDGLGVRTTRTGFMVIAPWAWAATTILIGAVLVQAWVWVARIAEIRRGTGIVEDHAGVTEGGMEEGLTAADEMPPSDAPPDRPDR